MSKKLGEIKGLVQGHRLVRDGTKIQTQAVWLLSLCSSSLLFYLLASFKGLRVEAMPFSPTMPSINMRKQEIFLKNQLCNYIAFPCSYDLVWFGLFYLRFPMIICNINQRNSTKMYKRKPMWPLTTWNCSRHPSSRCCGGNPCVKCHTFGNESQ